jgi:hypothetical protein
MVTLNLSRFRQAFPAELVSPHESNLAQVRGYEFDWSPYASALAELGRPEDQPSWLKAITDVAKAEGIWRGFYESLIGRTSGKLRGTNAADFALNHLVNDTVTGVMQFLPANATNEQSLKVAVIAQSLLPDWIVVSLNGDADATNEYAEEIVKDYAKQATVEGKRGVWVISQGMGARSFSVPEINVVLLTYDNGSLGSTVQKMSRCLTAGSVDKIGHIISFSIDGNRSDNIATMALDTALKAARESGDDLETVLRRVRRTIPIFDLDENGDCVGIADDEYLNRAMSLTAARQLVVNRQAVLEVTSGDADALLSLLADLPTYMDRLESKEVPFNLGSRFLDGRIVDHQNREIDEETLKRRLFQEIQEKLSVLTERMGYLVYFLPDRSSVTLDRVIQFVYSDQSIFHDFHDSFGVTPSELQWLLDKRLINREMLELVMIKSL